MAIEINFKEGRLVIRGEDPEYYLGELRSFFAIEGVKRKITRVTLADGVQFEFTAVKKTELQSKFEQLIELAKKTQARKALIHQESKKEFAEIDNKSLSLHVAIVKMKLDEVEQLLKLNTVVANGFNGMAYFDLALKSYNDQRTLKNEKSSEVLQRKKITTLLVNFPNVHLKGCTPLTAAITAKAEAKVNYLIEHFGAAIDTVDLNSNTAIHAAVLSKSTKLVEMLIKLPKTGAIQERKQIAQQEINVALKRKNNEGNLPVHIAASVGDAACMELLVAAGSDLSEKNNAGKTPLMLAQEVNNRSVLEYFRRLSTTADAKTTDRQLEHVERVNINDEMIRQELKQNWSRLTAEISKTTSSPVEAIVRDCFKKSGMALFNAIVLREEERRTWLQATVDYKQYDLIPVIVKSYLDELQHEKLSLDHRDKDFSNFINYQDEDGNTCLHLLVLDLPAKTKALQAKMRGVIDYLVNQCGALVSMQNSTSLRTVLHLAVMQKDLVLLKILLQAKDVRKAMAIESRTLEEGVGETVLDAAFRVKADDITNFLLEFSTSSESPSRLATVTKEKSSEPAAPVQPKPDAAKTLLAKEILQNIIKNVVSKQGVFAQSDSANNMPVTVPENKVSYGKV